MSKIVDQMKKLYEGQAVAKKDFNLKHLFTTENKTAKKYQKDDGTAELSVISIASKYVRKYDNEANGNRGFHTTLELANGEKTGAFSSALLAFAEFFYDLAGLPVDDYRRVEFDKPVTVKVTKVDLSEGKTTYNFELIGGDVTKLTRMGGAAQYASIISAADMVGLPEATPAE